MKYYKKKCFFINVLIEPIDGMGKCMNEVNHTQKHERFQIKFLCHCKIPNLFKMIWKVEKHYNKTVRQPKCTNFIFLAGVNRTETLQPSIKDNVEHKYFSLQNSMTSGSNRVERLDRQQTRLKGQRASRFRSSNKSPHFERIAVKTRFFQKCDQKETCTDRTQKPVIKLQKSIQLTAKKNI